MKVITEGHQYELAHFENPEKSQFISFIHKKEVDGKLTTVEDGTTNEEVLAMLIDRLEYLNKLAPHPQNHLALAGLLEALEALNRRTSERKARGVEGTPAK